MAMDSSLLTVVSAGDKFSDRSLYMGQVAISFLPPEYWQDFQRMTVDVYFALAILFRSIHGEMERKRILRRLTRSCQTLRFP